MTIDSFDDFVDDMDMSDLHLHQVVEAWGGKVLIYPTAMRFRINRRVIFGMVIGWLVGLAVREVIKNIIKKRNK